jgi:chromosome segregation ATPase
MLETDDANDYVADDVNDDVCFDKTQHKNEQVDIEAEILRSKLVAQLKAENAELKAERDKAIDTLTDEIQSLKEDNDFIETTLNEQVANLTTQLETSQSAFKRLREENAELLAELNKPNKELEKLRARNAQLETERYRMEMESLANQTEAAMNAKDSDKAIDVINEFRGKMKDTRNWTEFKKFVEELKRKQIL